MEFLRAILFGDPIKLAILSTELSPGSARKVRISFSSPFFAAGDLAGQIAAANAQIVMVDSSVAGFDLNALLNLRQTLKSPILFVGLAPAGTGQFDDLSASGLDKVYALPATSAMAQQMDNDLPPLYENAVSSWGHGAFTAITPQNVQAAMQASVQSSWRSASIAIISPKGGAGKTTLSVEMSVMLSQIGGRSTVLIDANMVSGHARFFLNAMAPSSILHTAEAYQAWKKSGGTGMPPTEVMASHLYPLDPDRKKLFLLPGIINSSQAANPALSDKDRRPDLFAKDLVDFFRRNYDFTVIDLGSDLNKFIHSGCLQAADYILLVCPPNRAAIADTKAYIDELSRRSISPEKFRLVLNQMPIRIPERMPTLEDAAKSLGIPALAVVHEETTGEMENTVNIGQSFVARFANRNDNPDEIELVLRDLASLSAQFYPPIATLWAGRKTKSHGKKRGLFGAGG